MQGLPLYRKDRLRLGGERQPGTCKMTSSSSQTHPELVSVQDASTDAIRAVSDTVTPPPKLKERIQRSAM